MHLGDDVMEKFGERIRKAVIHTGKPVTQLAKESGVSCNAWYDLIHGRRAPRLDTLLLVMEALGYKSLDKLLGIVP